MPSKALLRPVLALDDARRVAGAREAVSSPIAAAAVFKRRNHYVGDWDDSGQADWIDGIGATLVRGHGRLDGPRRVVVSTADGDVTLTARHAVVVCTGTRASLPDLPGMADARAWINREATEATSVPRRLAVVGAAWGGR